MKPFKNILLIPIQAIEFNLFTKFNSHNYGYENEILNRSEIQEQNFIEGYYRSHFFHNLDLIETDFIVKTFCFSPTVNLDKHLFLFNIYPPQSGYDVFLVNEVSIKCKEHSCTPIPDFTYNEDCLKEFIGINTGDG